MKIPSHFPWIVAFVLVAHVVAGLYLLGGNSESRKTPDPTSKPSTLDTESKISRSPKNPLEGVRFKANTPVEKKEAESSTELFAKQDRTKDLPRKPGGNYTKDDNQPFRQRFPSKYPVKEEPLKDETTKPEEEPTKLAEKTTAVTSVTNEEVEPKKQIPPPETPSIIPVSLAEAPPEQRKIKALKQTPKAKPVQSAVEETAVKPPVNDRESGTRRVRTFKAIKP